MYLTAYNTDQNVATCSPSTEGEHIISNQRLDISDCPWK